VLINWENPNLFLYQKRIHVISKYLLLRKKEEVFFFFMASERLKQTLPATLCKSEKEKKKNRLLTEGRRGASISLTKKENRRLLLHLKNQAGAGGSLASDFNAGKGRESHPFKYLLS